MTVDGRTKSIRSADQGGGGALLREKIASASKRMVVIADSTARATARRFMPIEVVPWPRGTRRHIERAFAKLAGWATFAGDLTSSRWRTILDCSLGAIPDPAALSELLSPIPGVVEHGLFVGLARAAIIAGDEGVEVLGDPN